MGVRTNSDTKNFFNELSSSKPCSLYDKLLYTTIKKENYKKLFATLSFENGEKKRETDTFMGVPLKKYFGFYFMNTEEIMPLTALEFMALKEVSEKEKFGLNITDLSDINNYPEKSVGWNRIKSITELIKPEKRMLEIKTKEYEKICYLTAKAKNGLYYIEQIIQGEKK